MTTPNKSGKLLVVDTSTAMLHVLKNFTSKHGYDADHFSDPADACDRLDQRFQDFSCDYRSIVLGWPEGRLNLVQELLQKLSTTDHDALPLIVVTQEMNADVKALVKRRPKTRAFLWSEYQQVAQIIDLTAKQQSKRASDKTIVARQSATTQLGTDMQDTASSASSVTKGPVLEKAVSQGSHSENTGSENAAHGVGSQVADQSNNRFANYSTSFSLLLVDTAPSICESLRQKLKSAGYQISVAGSVTEAREQLDKNEFDVVVTDFFLRDESGEALCKELQASEMGLKPVCVVLTAKYSDSIVKRSLAVGAAACLYKNESTELLFARIDALTRTLRRQSLQSLQQQPQQSRQLAPQQPNVVRASDVKEGQTVSLHTATHTELQPSQENANGSGRRGVVKLVTRPIADKPSSVVQTKGFDQVTPATQRTAKTSVGKTGISENPDAETTPKQVQVPQVEPVTKHTELDISVSVPELLCQLENRNPSAQYSMLMLDVEIVAATGDRMALCDSEPMQNLVARSLRKLYPKQKAQACTDDGKFVLLLTTVKFQDALVLTRKILQLIPKMVPYLNNMGLVSHAGIVRIEKDEVIDQNSLLKRCGDACQKTRADRKDNAALVLPNNQYLSAVVPQADKSSGDAQIKGPVSKEPAITEPAITEQAAKALNKQEQKEPPQTA